MRRAACLLPGLLIVGVMYWSTALGLGGVSLAWLLSGQDEADDELALELTPPPRPLVPLGLADRTSSCWMLAAEDPSPGEVQRWRLSRCASREAVRDADSVSGVLYDAVDLAPLSDTRVSF